MIALRRLQRVPSKRKVVAWRGGYAVRACPGLLEHRPRTSPNCLPELGARSAVDFERIASDDQVVKPIEPETPELYMSEIALNIFVNVLSRPTHFPKGAQTGHLFIAEPPRPFVAPRLDIPGKDPSIIQKEVIFIEASGAVGKSTLARQLSATLKAPILDLAKVPVSTGSLHKLLAELEAADKSDPVAAFHEGKIPVIVDALDEGRLLSNETAIESFLITTGRAFAEQPKRYLAAQAGLPGKVRVDRVGAAVD